MIRYRFTILLLAVSVWLSGHAALADPPGTGWRLSFEDNFDGDALDTGVWTIHTGARRNAVNTADAIRVGGGNLTITTYTSEGRHYTGFLSTNRSFLGTFGYWEARIKFQDAPGMWSAFWLQSPTMGNPIGDPATAGTEIDITEHRVRDNRGADISNKSVSNLHWDGYGSSHRSVGSGLVNNPTGPSLQGNFHTYGLLWTPDRYEFFIDGRRVWRTTQAVSHRSEFIFLTSEVQNNSWAGSIPAGGYGDRSSSRVQMVVDWVRVWQRPLYGLDIGAVQLPGGDDLDDGGTWTVRGAGDTWNMADRFHFVYLPMIGDGWILAQVSGVDHPDPSTKSGVMMRETLNPNAKNVTLSLTAGGDVTFQSRQQTGGGTGGRGSLPGVGIPYGLYLERVGDIFNAWTTADYINWDFLGSETLAMARKVYVGLAAGSHNTSVLNTSYFDGVMTSLDGATEPVSGSDP